MLEFLLNHIELVVFLTVLAEQVGVPIPAIPVLLAAGAVAGDGQAYLTVLTGISVIACLLGDMLWFELGRHRGRQALKLLCRISLEPDACVRKTETFFSRHGLRALILAKFIPGFSTLAPALAGLFKISIARFFFYNGIGALLWSVSYLILGYILSDQISWLGEQAAQLGKTAGTILAVSLVGYVFYRYVHRQKLLRELRVARITPGELKQLMDDGHPSVVVDLRDALDHATDPYTIPGALRISPEQLDQRYLDIPRDRDVILFLRLSERSDRRTYDANAEAERAYTYPPTPRRYRRLARAVLSARDGFLERSRSPLSLTQRFHYQIYNIGAASNRLRSPDCLSSDSPTCPAGGIRSCVVLSQALAVPIKATPLLLSKLESDAHIILPTAYLSPR